MHFLVSRHLSFRPQRAIHLWLRSRLFLYRLVILSLPRASQRGEAKNRTAEMLHFVQHDKESADLDLALDMWFLSRRGATSSEAAQIPSTT